MPSYYTLTQPPPLRVPFDPPGPPRCPFPEALHAGAPAPPPSKRPSNPGTPRRPLPARRSAPPRPRVVRTDRLALHIAPPAPASAAARWRGRGRGEGVAPRAGGAAVAAAAAAGDGVSPAAGQTPEGTEEAVMSRYTRPPNTSLFVRNVADATR